MSENRCILYSPSPWPSPPGEGICFPIQPLTLALSPRRGDMLPYTIVGE
ncbi:MAG: hypothetical protein KJ063_04110 [Anaerolineae bacterium]|nr:hypothetical protein [Anaerolineae bacterium]